MIFAASNRPSMGSPTKENAEMQKITPFLWFDTKAEEAASFYTSIFKNSGIVSVARYGEAGPGPKGSVMTVAFKLDGQDFVALNGGPQFEFTLAISFVVNCKTQEEVDYFWGKLSQGGKTDRCGWLKDKFGLSWRSEEHTSELQSRLHLVCRLLLEKKKKILALAFVEYAVGRLA